MIYEIIRNDIWGEYRPLFVVIKNYCIEVVCGKSLCIFNPRDYE